jgi:hypothetical protein
VGFAVSREGAVPWAALGARVGFDVPLSARWFVRATIDVEAPLTRPSLTLNGATQWEASPVTGALTAAMGATFL